MLRDDRIERAVALAQAGPLPRPFAGSTDLLHPLFTGAGNAPGNVSGRREIGATAKPVTIRVRGRFEPQTIVACSGEPLLLDVCRESGCVCSDRFVFAAFGIDLPLPVGRPVRIELPPLGAGAYSFGCRFGTLRGTLIVR